MIKEVDSVGTTVIARLAPRLATNQCLFCATNILMREGNG